jgi:hypothetical protein
MVAAVKQLSFYTYVISLVADTVIIRRRDAKRWKNDYLVKGVSLPPLAYSGGRLCVCLGIEVQMLIE